MAKLSNSVEKKPARNANLFNVPTYTCIHNIHNTLDIALIYCKLPLAEMYFYFLFVNVAWKKTHFSDKHCLTLKISI